MQENLGDMDARHTLVLAQIRPRRVHQHLVCVCVCVCACVLSLHSCPTLYDVMDCSPPGSSVQGLLQARVLEWVAMPSSRGSSRPRD